MGDSQLFRRGCAGDHPRFFGPVAKLGAGSFYLSTYHDSNGAPLLGGNNYSLHVPANVPAHEFWALTCMTWRRRPPERVWRRDQ
ncbi:MAG TPA: DUF1214 domain-containing protein [Roseiarcus sp.]|nr:DUF1214 domain-containing protein [Roseiarcus sp.]